MRTKRHRDAEPNNAGSNHETGLTDRRGRIYRRSRRARRTGVRAETHCRARQVETPALRRSRGEGDKGAEGMKGITSARPMRSLASLQSLFKRIHPPASRRLCVRFRDLPLRPRLRRSPDFLSSRFIRFLSGFLQMRLGVGWRAMMGRWVCSPTSRTLRSGARSVCISITISILLAI